MTHVHEIVVKRVPVVILDICGPVQLLTLHRPLKLIVSVSWSEGGIVPNCLIIDGLFGLLGLATSSVHQVILLTIAVIFIILSAVLLMLLSLLLVLLFLLLVLGLFRLRL